MTLRTAARRPPGKKGPGGTVPMRIKPTLQEARSSEPLALPALRPDVKASCTRLLEDAVGRAHRNEIKACVVVELNQENEVVLHHSDGFTGLPTALDGLKYLFLRGCASEGQAPRGQKHTGMVMQEQESAVPHTITTCDSTSVPERGTSRSLQGAKVQAPLVGRGTKRPRTVLQELELFSLNDNDEDGEEDDSEWEGQIVPLPHRVTRTVEAGDHDALTYEYVSRFEEVQQDCLKRILKAWIKSLEPKKQANYPYAASDPKKCPDGIVTEEKIPPWWPPNVRHKEPDHTDTRCRIVLAVFILRLGMKQGTYGYDSWVQRLKAIANSQNLEIQNQKNAEARRKQREFLMNDICRIAQFEEEFVNGEIDYDATISCDNVQVLYGRSRKAAPAPRKRAKGLSGLCNQAQTDDGHDDHRDFESLLDDGEPWKPQIPGQLDFRYAVDPAIHTSVCDQAMQYFTNMYTGRKRPGRPKKVVAQPLKAHARKAPIPRTRPQPRRPFNKVAHTVFDEARASREPIATTPAFQPAQEEVTADPGSAWETPSMMNINMSFTSSIDSPSTGFSIAPEHEPAPYNGIASVSLGDRDCYVTTTADSQKSIYQDMPPFGYPATVCTQSWDNVAVGRIQGLPYPHPLEMQQPPVPMQAHASKEHPARNYYTQPFTSSGQPYHFAPSSSDTRFPFGPY